MKISDFRLETSEICCCMSTQFLNTANLWFVVVKPKISDFGENQAHTARGTTLPPCIANIYIVTLYILSDHSKDWIEKGNSPPLMLFIPILNSLNPRLHLQGNLTCFLFFFEATVHKITPPANLSHRTYHSCRTSTENLY